MKLFSARVRTHIAIVLAFDVDSYVSFYYRSWTGTGHCGVGSIIGASNARVANLIGADMVLVRTNL
jgi:hypothetical protein